MSSCPLKWLCQFTFSWYYEAWNLLLISVLISIFLVTTDIGHLFVCLFSNFYFLPVNCLFIFFAHLSSVFFSYWFVKSPLYVPDTNPLFYILQMFSTSLLSLNFVFYFFELFNFSDILNYFFWLFWNKVLDYKSNINDIGNLGNYLSK